MGDPYGTGGAPAGAPSRASAESRAPALTPVRTSADKPLMIITEYMENGALDKFLRVRMWAQVGWDPGWRLGAPGGRGLSGVPGGRGLAGGLGGRGLAGAGLGGRPGGRGRLAAEARCPCRRRTASSACCS